MLLTILGIGAALVVCTLIFAGAVCWLAHEEETTRGEEDNLDARPMLKVSVVKKDDEDEISPKYRAAVKEWHWEDEEDDV